jgi:hypothetical protein
MKHSIAIRFCIAAGLITAGCSLLLLGFSNGGVLFALATVFFMPRSELTRPIPRRELWLTFGALVLLITLIVAAKFFIPKSASDVMEKIISDPAVVVPLWLLMLWGLFRHWQRQKGEADA